MLIALLPPVLLAQDSNGIHTRLCPASISSNIAATYVLVWGLPFAIIACGYFARQNIPDKLHFALVFTASLMYTFWLCLTQFSMWNKARCRTSVGKALFGLASMSAVLLTLVSIILFVFGILTMKFKNFICMNFDGSSYGSSYPKISNVSSSTVEGLMEWFADDSSDCENISKSRTAIDVNESKLGFESSSDCVKVIETEIMRTRKRRSCAPKTIICFRP